MDDMNATSSLRKVLTDMRVDFEVQRETEEQIDFLVTVRNTDFTVWYNSAKSLYGFNMLNGGFKTYPSPLDFKKYFELYIEINLVFIPNAKIVSNLFEKEMGYNSIYDKFSGNKDGGFVAKFNVLDNEAFQFFIRNGKVDDKGNHYYAASLVEWNDDKTKNRTIVTYQYVVDEVQNCHLIPDIEYFVDVIDGLYGSRSEQPISFERIDSQKFRVDFKEIKVEFGVLFTDTDIKYIVTKLNDKSVNEEIDMKDSLDWDELKSICLSLYDLESEEDATEPEANNQFTEDTSSISDDEFDFDDAEDTGDIAEVSADLEKETIEESAENSEEAPLDDSEFDFSDAEEVVKTESSESNESNNAEESLEKDIEEVTTEDTIKPEDSDSTEEDSSSVESSDEKDNNDEADSKDEVEGQEEFEEPESATDDFEEPETTITEESTESNESEQAITSEDTPATEDTPVTEDSPVTEEETKSTNEVPEREVSDTMEIKLVLQDGKPVRVRFKDGISLFDISYDKALELKVPVNFITESTSLIKHKGMVLTEEEVQLHVFAVDITDDESAISSCIEAYFA